MDSSTLEILKVITVPVFTTIITIIHKIYELKSKRIEKFNEIVIKSYIDYFTATTNCISQQTVDSIAEYREKYITAKLFFDKRAIEFTKEISNLIGKGEYLMANKKQIEFSEWLSLHIKELMLGTTPRRWRK